MVASTAVAEDHGQAFRGAGEFRKDGNSVRESLLLELIGIVPPTYDPDDDRFPGRTNLNGQIGKVQPDTGIANSNMEKDCIHLRVAKNGRERAAVDIDIGADVTFQGRPEVDRIGDRHPLRE